MTAPDSRSPDAETGDGQPSLPALFQPLVLRSVSFSNRIVVTPMCQYVAEDGHSVLWHRSHHGRFALAGVGGAIVESTGVTREGRITPGCLGIYLDEHVAGLRRIVDIYHDQRIPVGIQLSHAGRKASAAVPLEGAAPLVDCDPGRAWQALAPSALPLSDGWPVPKEMTEAEVEATIEAFANAADRALAAGFDFLEIHGAHGYLINSFFSPLANRRADHWGGASLENRMRFPLAVTKAIRKRMPSDMPLFYRTSAVDGFDGGVSIEDTIALAIELKACGVDLLDCSSGGISGASGRAFERPRPGYLVPYAAAVRHAAGIATMAVGLIIDAEQANAIITEKQADLVAMGRQLLAEPNFPYHAAQTLRHPDPESVLPEAYGFFLRRRKLD
jgi:2,4-dienoyl-CoA reductase-like NADH-dependent reductase (Old Yellow Enzyme family)